MCAGALSIIGIGEVSSKRPQPIKTKPKTELVSHSVAWQLLRSDLWWAMHAL